jgi:D-glycero-D-manno-heptose 1,7-bisphosphate phosphatase
MSAPDKIIVLDRDGVINEDSDDYIKSADEWIPLAGSLEAIGRLCSAGYRVAVISNQSGIGRGLFDITALEQIHAKMVAEVEAAGGRLSGIYYCPHRPIDHCDCRKPKVGLIRELAADLGLASLACVPLIGDKLSDLQLARAVGARGILVRTGKGTQTAAALGADSGVEIYNDLAAAVDAVLAQDDE